MEDGVRPYLDRGEVVAVLEEHCPAFAGYSLCHPSDARPHRAARALIDDLLRMSWSPATEVPRVSRIGRQPG